MAERSYQYPAKDRIRQDWMDFQPALYRDQRDFILYLPARENLEFDLYTAKGLAPSQMVGAEHCDGEYSHVAANSRGINLVQGNIRDTVEFIESRGLPRLRAANLDFDGRSHTFTEELLALARVMPSSRGSSLAITSYAARDRNGLIQGTVNAAKICSAVELEQFLPRYGRMLSLYRNLLHLIPNSESTPAAHFQREMGLLWWIVLMFGVVNPPEKTQGYYVLDTEFLESSRGILDHLTDEVQERLGANPRESDVVLLQSPELQELLAKRRVHVWITAMKRLAYWSSGRQPMRTWFFKVQPLLQGDGFSPTMQDLVAQVWKLACSAPIVFVDDAGVPVQIG